MDVHSHPCNHQKSLLISCSQCLLVGHGGLLTLVKNVASVSLHLKYHQVEKERGASPCKTEKLLDE